MLAAFRSHRGCGDTNDEFGALADGSAIYVVVESVKPLDLIKVLMFNEIYYKMES